MFLRASNLFICDCLGCRHSTFPVLRSFLELNSIFFFIVNHILFKFMLCWVCDELSSLWFASLICICEPHALSIAAAALGVTALWNAIRWNWYSLSVASFLDARLSGCSPAAATTTLNHFLFERFDWSLYLPYGSFTVIVSIRRCLVTVWGEIRGDLTQARYFTDLYYVIIESISPMMLHIFQ